MARKTYILDTNVLIHDPESIFCFQENEVVIPFEALEELDKLKKRYDYIGHNARQTIRCLGALIEQGGRGNALTMKEGGTLRLDSCSRITAGQRLSASTTVPPWTTGSSPLPGSTNRSTTAIRFSYPRISTHG
jgi:predicted ribonuclease YlaK